MSKTNFFGTFLLANLVFFYYCSPPSTVLLPHTSHKTTHILTHIKCNCFRSVSLENSLKHDISSCQDPSISPYCLLLSPNDFVVSCLRLQTPIDCIQHSYYMYTKYLTSYYDRGCTGEFWNKLFSLKLFFCELNVVGMVCWTNSCQTINKKNHGNPSVTGQNTFIYVRRPT